MYKEELKTFIEVVELGSFTKASERLFISSTAVMKQMNQLEADLGIKLLIRNNQGISLTKEGEKIYKEARYITKYCDDIVQSLQKNQKKEAYTINLGTSLTCSCKPIMDLWNKKAKLHPEFKIKIIPFDDNHTNTLLTLQSGNKDIDLIVTACDSKNWLKNLSFHKLGTTKYALAVPLYHRLANKEFITYKDLANESIMTITSGDSPVSNELYESIKENCKDINIVSCPFFYDIDVFNTAHENGYLLTTLENWKDIHPAFKTIPFEFQGEVNYGIIYPKNPKKEVKKFLNIILNEQDS